MFGDAYQYLLRMYSTNTSRGGERFTPQELSEALAEIAVNKRKKTRHTYETFMPR
ncbi:N-6 DNA methylase [Corynebacterium pseudotuberculosis]|uniref:N-6 DNA methylase n=1 Tax=Corynebacterium pseudotuberculosis TaxID=1719 RepID=UPI0009BF532B|nr:N-6 DNA methylase [Corynebacterium pseudotuberculosis]QGX02916.1 N-6 DNA methylase [Corynebacterium pseudotuberculosis Cp162]WFP66596.1 N-6 DNA methylase [Corynebacterium pseudotuberculosis]